MGSEMNVGRMLTRRAILSPEKEGLVCEGIRRTFLEMNNRANQLANAMTAMGVKRGDRVGVLAFNEAEFYDLMFGLGKIGATMVPVNYRLAGPEVQYILSDSSPNVFIFSPEYVDLVDSIRNEIPAKELLAIMDSPPEWAKPYESVISQASADEPELVGENDDTLTILYTSGTTGRPKGAELTHAYYFWSNVNIHSTIPEFSESILIALPLFHIGALAGPPLCVHAGARSVLLRTFDPTRFLELIQEEKINAFGSVPALLSFLKFVPDFEKYDWSSVKVILVYAAPVPVTLLNEYEEAGIEVRQLYGMTECNTGSVLDGAHARAKMGSCGRPFMHTEIRLVDADGNDVPVGETGEILMRSPNVMKGYWNRPEDTAATIVDGWLHSGDMARVDEDGFYYIMDRKKDMIISGGENIYPAEIEDSLLAHPAIADVGVIGYPDERWGEAVKAVVVLQEGHSLTEKELIEWCQGKIGRYKIPKAIVFADSLPRTPTGKILKRVLRDEYN
jgi:acyl-CoA synthetase (AMP-forming)/AMP-acid ligase II